MFRGKSAVSVVVATTRRPATIISGVRTPTSKVSVDGLLFVACRSRPSSRPCPFPEQRRVASLPRQIVYQHANRAMTADEMDQVVKEAYEAADDARRHGTRTLTSCFVFPRLFWLTHIGGGVYSFYS